MSSIENCTLIITEDINKIGMNIEGVDYVFDIKTDVPELIVVSREHQGELTKVYYEGKLEESNKEIDDFKINIGEHCDSIANENACRSDPWCWWTYDGDCRLRNCDSSWYYNKNVCLNTGGLCCWDSDLGKWKGWMCDGCCYECGEYEEPVTCTDTCSSLGYECGYQTVCESAVNCGTCGSGYECENGQCVTEEVPSVGVFSASYSGYYKQGAYRYYTSILKETSGNAGITVTARQKCYKNGDCDAIKYSLTSGAQNYGTNYIPPGGQISASGAYWYSTIPGDTMTETFWGTSGGQTLIAKYTLS